MRYRPWRSLLMLASVVLAMATAAGDADSHGEALIEWLRSKDGFFNPELEIRRADPNDSSSRLGVFAKGNLQENELLLLIPPHCLITAKVPLEKKDFLGASMECDTIRNMIKEMKLGADSEYAPYINYLLSQSPGQLPSAWSRAGKDLFLKVLGVSTSTGEQILPPKDAVRRIEQDWYEKCDGGHDPFEEHVALLVLQRAHHDVIVPMFDMLNHRNGRWLNAVESTIRAGETARIRALRDIEAGEEVYSTYDLDWGDNTAEQRTAEKLYDYSFVEDYPYGTAELLRDFGFVEEYPQRWIFLDQEFAFELDEKFNDDGTGSGELKITWIGDEPSDEAVSFLREQLQRLKDLAEADLKSADETIPKNEWDVIWQYHQALTVAMSHAIAAALGEDVKEYLAGESATDTSSLDTENPRIDCEYLESTAQPIPDQSIWKKLRVAYRLALAGSQDFSFPSSDSDNESGFCVPYEVRESPGKGRGIFLTQSVRRGEVLWKSKYTALFRNEHEYRKFLSLISHDLACNVQNWSYVTRDNRAEAPENSYIVNVIMDDGALVNGEDDEVDANIGCSEEDESLCGFVEDLLALRDIEAGEELIESYDKYGNNAEELPWWQSLVHDSFDHGDWGAELNALYIDEKKRAMTPQDEL